MRKGFNLIESMIVLLFLGIVLVILYLATAPLWHKPEIDLRAEQIKDVMAISNALALSKVDNFGLYSPYIENLSPGTAVSLGLSDAELPFPCVVNLTDNLDLNYLLEGDYLSYIPISPAENNKWDENYTGYYLEKNIDHSITIGACQALGDEPIEITR